MNEENVSDPPYIGRPEVGEAMERVAEGPDAAVANQVSDLTYGILRF